MRQSQSGISLVEVLIVLAIISVIAFPAIIASGRSGESGRADTEAQKFAVRLTLAADRAVTSGRALPMGWDETSYQFGILEGAELARSGAAGYELPGSLRLSSEMPAELMIGPDHPYNVRWRIADNSAAALVEFDGLSARVLANGK